MTQELSVEEVHQHLSEIQYAKYKSSGKYSNKDTDFRDVTHLYLGGNSFSSLTNGAGRAKFLGH
jgi:hypothetical protein